MVRMKQAGTFKRIGLFGGSFDPVHLGHLLVAQAACEELGLDRLFFIPAARSRFKPEREPTSASLRLQMLRLALAGKPDYEVDEQEVRRGGVSYTIDTVRDYARRFPGAQLFCLIGADHVAQLPQWREAVALAQGAEFVVVPRPLTLPLALSGGERLDRAPPGFRLRRLQGFPCAISASQIRERVKAGRPIDPLVPAAVAEVIRNNRLYL